MELKDLPSFENQSSDSRNFRSCGSKAIPLAFLPWDNLLGLTERQRSYPAFEPVRWATALSYRSPRVGTHAHSFPRKWETCSANRG
jgi:hypothetical protein